GVEKGGYAFFGWLSANTLSLGSICLSNFSVEIIESRHKMIRLRSLLLEVCSFYISFSLLSLAARALSVISLQRTIMPPSYDFCRELSLFSREASCDANWQRHPRV